MAAVTLAQLAACMLLVHSNRLAGQRRVILCESDVDELSSLAVDTPKWCVCKPGVHPLCIPEQIDCALIAQSVRAAKWQGAVHAPPRIDAYRDGRRVLIRQESVVTRELVSWATVSNSAVELWLAGCSVLRIGV